MRTIMRRIAGQLLRGVVRALDEVSNALERRAEAWSPELPDKVSAKEQDGRDFVAWHGGTMEDQGVMVHALNCKAFVVPRGRG